MKRDLPKGHDREAAMKMVWRSLEHQGLSVQSMRLPSIFGGTEYLIKANDGSGSVSVTIWDEDE